MTAITPLEFIHKKGIFGDHHKKNESDLLKVSEIKNLTIIQLVQYKGSKVNINDIKIESLEFKNPIERDIDLKNSKLTGNWRLEPKKNRLVVFPSYLYHKIEKNTSDEVRHSLAFNVMPDGIIGQNDSTFVY